MAAMLWRMARAPEHRLEVSLLALGAFFRISMMWDFRPDAGYDFPFHWGYVTYIAEHWSLPPRNLNVTAYHPPFYYLLAGGMVALGANAHLVKLFSVLCGIGRLLLLAWGLRRFLPGHKAARAIALLLAALLPAAVHMDGMVSAEALSNLFTSGSLALAAVALTAPPTTSLKRRLQLGLLLGLTLGFGFLTKVSSLALVPALGAGFLLQALAVNEGGLRGRGARLVPLVLALTIMAALAAPWCLDNLRVVGKLVPTSFDTYQQGYLKDSAGLPEWKRRAPAFFFSFTPKIYSHPYAPTAAGGPADARFWSLMVATTFADHYNFAFCPPGLPGGPQPRYNGREGREGSEAWAGASVAGGTVVALLTALAWLCALPVLLRRRDAARLVLVTASLCGLLGQLHFATKYPVDILGVVKGVYVHFAAPSLYALYGLAVVVLWERRWGRPFAVLSLGALVPICLYDIYCRIACPIADAVWYLRQ